MLIVYDFWEISAMTTDTRKGQIKVINKSNHLAPYEGMQLDTQQEQTCLTRFKTGGQERNMNCQQ